MVELVKRKEGKRASEVGKREGLNSRERHEWWEATLETALGDKEFCHAALALRAVEDDSLQ